MSDLQYSKTWKDEEAHFSLNRSVRDELLDLGLGLLQGLCRNIRHENPGAFFDKQDAGLETDASAPC